MTARPDRRPRPRGDGLVTPVSSRRVFSVRAALGDLDETERHQGGLRRPRQDLVVEVGRLLGGAGGIDRCSPCSSIARARRCQRLQPGSRVRHLDYYANRVERRLAVKDNFGAAAPVFKRAGACPLASQGKQTLDPTHNAPPVVSRWGVRVSWAAFAGPLACGLLLVLAWFFWGPGSSIGASRRRSPVGGRRRPGLCRLAQRPGGPIRLGRRGRRWESLGYQAGVAEYGLSVLADFQHALLLRLEETRPMPVCDRPGWRAKHPERY